MGKIDPLKPPSCLTDAAMAVGAGATTTGLDTLLRKYTRMRDAGLGGPSALLRKMLGFSEIIDTQAGAPRPSMEASESFIHDLLCLVRNSDFLQLSPPSFGPSEDRCSALLHPSYRRLV